MTKKKTLAGERTVPADKKTRVTLVVILLLLLPFLIVCPVLVLREIDVIPGIAFFIGAIIPFVGVTRGLLGHPIQTWQVVLIWWTSGHSGLILLTSLGSDPPLATPLVTTLTISWVIVLFLAGFLLASQMFSWSEPLQPPTGSPIQSDDQSTGRVSD